MLCKLPIYTFSATRTVTVLHLKHTTLSQMPFYFKFFTLLPPPLFIPSPVIFVSTRDLNVFLCQSIHTHYVTLSNIWVHFSSTTTIIIIIMCISYGNYLRIVYCNYSIQKLKRKIKISFTCENTYCWIIERVAQRQEQLEMHPRFSLPSWSFFFFSWFLINSLKYML